MAKEKVKTRQVEVFLAVVGIVMLCTALTLVFIVHATWPVIVNELIGQCIFASFTLLLYEPMHRKLVTGEKLSRTYKISVAIFFVALTFLYAGYKVKTVTWLVIDWVIAVVFGALGLVWFYKVLGHETELEYKADAKQWEKKKKLYVESGMTEEEIAADAGKFLQWYPEGDTLEGALDMGHPVSSEGLSLAEMVTRYPESAVSKQAQEWLKKAAHTFVTAHTKEAK